MCESHIVTSETSLSDDSRSNVPDQQRKLQQLLQLKKEPRTLGLPSVGIGKSTQVGLTQEEEIARKTWNKRYIAQVYSTTHIEGSKLIKTVHIPVFWDLEYYRKIIKETYSTKGVEDGPQTKINIVSGELSLDVGQLPKGWVITPLTPLKLLREDIDSYSAGTDVPIFQMEFSWDGDGPPKSLRHKVIFHGVQSDDSFITVIVDPELLGPSTSLGSLLPSHVKEVDSHTVKRNSATGGDIDRASDSGEAVLHALSLCPRLAQLESIWTPKDRIDIIRSVAPWWKKIGLLLKISEATLDVIHANNEDLLSQCRNMFQCWLEGASVKPVSWATLLEALQDCGFYVLAQNVTDVLSTIFQFPDIHGANILSEVEVKISPGKPLTYQWKGTGLNIHIPAGAIESECGPVTMSIQASLSGEYQLPDDHNLVSGVYWISLSPPVKFAKKVTISIQHCASETDDTLSFITAKCTQKNLPYQFKGLPGGSFSESCVGSIQVDRFSAFGISGSDVSCCALSTYYIPKQINIWEAHIIVTPNLQLALELVRQRYTNEFRGAERGPCLLAKFDRHEIALSIPEVGVSEHTWTISGWELCLLVSPRSLIDYAISRTTIPSFMIQMKLINHADPQPLRQKVNFEGVRPPDRFITLTREPEHQDSVAAIRPSPSAAAVVRSTRGAPPSMPELLRLRVPQHVGANYSTFGIFLLNDITGDRVDIFEDEYRGKPERIVQKILQEWLKGRGLPVTWESLIQTLRDTDLSNLADQIQATKLSPH